MEVSTNIYIYICHKFSSLATKYISSSKYFDRMAFQCQCFKFWQFQSRSIVQLSILLVVYGSTIYIPLASFPTYWKTKKSGFMVHSPHSQHSWHFHFFSLFNSDTQKIPEKNQEQQILRWLIQFHNYLVGIKLFL